MIGLEGKIYVFSISFFTFCERRFLKNRFITAYLWSLLEGYYRFWANFSLDKNGDLVYKESDHLG